MKKPRGKFVNGAFRVYRPTRKELELAAQLQAPEKKTPPAQEEVRTAVPLPTTCSN